jgi:hypothetical protein
MKKLIFYLVFSDSNNYFRRFGGRTDFEACGYLDRQRVQYLAR